MKVEGKEEGQISYRTIIVGPTNGRCKKIDKKYVGVFAYVLYICHQMAWAQIYKREKTLLQQICQSL